MKKISFIGLIALALSYIPLSGFAQTVQKKMITCLVLTETNGTTTEFALESFPVITIEGNNLVITHNGNQLTTALTGVQDYHFIEKTVTTSISSVPSNDPKNESNTPQFSFSNAEVSGLKAGARVAIYNLNGTQISSVTADGEGRVALDFSSLPKGVYILRTPTKSFKFMNK
ncbi:Por secretion system C-terminal sorting domain protein [Prevotella sp. ICM33]|uniref:T9SS type A sorting domain-containing protein n=1 Tax=Prevotella TaxID=838 RepID=UPI00044A9354|nr:T9SS type A sorting domain-containing protein [Prevotella sp. ICM33]ETS97176.1 Por secretion system C-terminal sorting domain protein [Prevotella sp. ICM33]